MTHQPSATRDDVLRAFAMEFGEGPTVLKRYLTEYPQFGIDLVNLSRELSRSEAVDEELAEDDVVGASRAVERFRNRATQRIQLSELRPKAFQEAARQLNLPLQVMIAFRERRVDLASVPVRFRNALAQALRTTVEMLDTFLALPPQVSLGRASKSGVKPVAAEKVSFERILKDAGVSAERISELAEAEE